MRFISSIIYMVCIYNLCTVDDINSINMLHVIVALIVSRLLDNWYIDSTLSKIEDRLSSFDKE